MVATFNGNPRATIIFYFSPTNISEETELFAFYDELSSFVRSIPKQNVLGIGRDMNAQIGKNGNHKYSLHNLSNTNGQHLTYFTIENRLIFLNTNFQKRDGKLWTYTYANNTKAQRDFVFINKNGKIAQKIARLIPLSWVCPPVTELSWQKCDWANNKIAPEQRPAYTMNGLFLKKKDIRDKYVIALRNKFDVRQETTETRTPNGKYENFVNAHQEAAAKYIPKRLRTKSRVPCETLAVRENMQAWKLPPNAIGRTQLTQMPWN